MKKPLIFIISWCSWVWKNTVWEHVEKNSWIGVKRVVTTTSREKRPHENHWDEYYFITKEEFEKKIDSWEMFEWTLTHNILYWSTKDELYKILADGLIPVYIIDVKWHSSMKEKLKDSFDINSIFILPPSFEALEERLASRWTESEERIQTRLQTAKEELEHMTEYDYLVINNKIDECSAEIRWIIDSVIRH
jgi:guanylate kinase